MPLTAVQKRGLKAGVLLGGVVIVLAIALHLNSPSSKRVDFNLVCTSFMVPVKLTLKLNSGEAQMESAVFRGFEGAVTNVEAVTVLQRQGRPLKFAPAALTLSSSKNQPLPPPYVDARPDGAYGTMELEAMPGVILFSNGTKDGKPRLSLSSQSFSDASLVLQSEKLLLKGNRYAIREIRRSDDALDAFELRIVGHPPGQSLELKALATKTPAPRADVTFPTAQEEIKLMSGLQQPAAAFKNMQLKFWGTKDPDLRVEGKKLAGVISDRPVDLIFDAPTGRIEALRMLNEAEKKNGPALRVIGSVTAKSVRQDRQELLPTWAWEAMDKPYSERGVWLAGLGLIAFALFKALDHAVGILLKILLPEK